MKALDIQGCTTTEYKFLKIKHTRTKCFLNQAYEQIEENFKKQKCF